MKLLGMALPGILTTTSGALERTSVRVDAFERSDWSAAQSCTVRYYNNCTGWVWVWAGWEMDELAGTAFHSCCDAAVLRLTNYLTFSGDPAGWGFTGTIAVFDADANECAVGPPLATQPWNPPATSAWYSRPWDIPVPRDFVVRIAWGAASGFTNPTGLASDHPAAGPTGPPACGLCFPTARVTHSYLWGTKDAPLCPGAKPGDGVCDVEFLLDVELACPVHVEDRSWAGVKTLYR